MKKHAKTLYGLVRQLIERTGREDVRGVEIGVARGRTSEVLLRRFPKLQLAMVDPWREWRIYKGRIREQAYCDQQLRDATERTEFASHRRVVLRMTSEEAAGFLGDVDFAFIDGSHLYMDVKQDLELWGPKTRSLLCGHDYIVPETWPKHRRRPMPVGVRTAVERYCRRHGHTVELDLPRWMWWVWK